MRQMNWEESEAHVVGLVLAQMYILRKGTELFREKAEQATMTELLQIDDFELYKPLHKHELSKQDRKDALESMIKMTEKRADEEGNRKIKSWIVADGSKQRSYSWIDHGLQSGPTLAFLLWLSEFKTKTSFGFLIKNQGSFFIFSKSQKMSSYGQKRCFWRF